MTKKALTIQIAVALLLAVFHNFVILKAVNNSPARALIRNIQGMKPAKVLFAGNSLMAAGYNGEAYHSVHPDRNAANIALGATEPPEQYMLLRIAKTQTPATLYYGFFDLQLTKIPPGEWSDISGNRQAGLLTGEMDTALSVYAPGDPFKAAQLRAAASIPVVFNRYQIWAKTELLRRKVGGLGLAATKTNEFGDVNAFAALETGQKQLAEACTEAVQQKTPFSLAMREMIDFCHQKNIKMVFIKMPMPSRHRQLFYQLKEWQPYETYIRSLMKDEHIDFIDASTWVPDDKFMDNLHLNPEGGALFTKRLAQTTN